MYLRTCLISAPITCKVARKAGCYTTELMFPRKLAALAALCIAPILAQPVTPSDFFETKVRPVFASQCFACHNAKMKTAGLDLSTGAGLLKGATSGPIISKDDPEKSRLTILRGWVLDHQVTEIDMSERQFWNFAALQPVAEKPWTTFMGRLISVSDMPQEAQKQLGIFNKNSPGMI